MFESRFRVALLLLLSVISSNSQAQENGLGVENEVRLSGETLAAAHAQTQPTASPDASATPGVAPSPPDQVKIGNWTIRTTVLIAIIGIAGAIIGGFFTVIIWPYLKTLIDKLYSKLETRFSGRNFEYRYLDWVISEHRYLPVLPTTLVPVTEKKVQELDDFYVSLAVSQDAGQKQLENINIGLALNDNPMLVILGDPGAGKTTILRFLALTFARARRKSPPRNNDAEYEEEKNKIKIARERVKREFYYPDYPLPVFVYLNRIISRYIHEHSR